jgi:hypothetical protein
LESDALSYYKSGAEVHWIGAPGDILLIMSVLAAMKRVGAMSSDLDIRYP